MPTSFYYSTARSLGQHLIKVRVPYLEQSRFSVQTEDEEQNTSEAESLLNYYSLTCLGIWLQVIKREDDRFIFLFQVSSCIAPMP